MPVVSLLDDLPPEAVRPDWLGAAALRRKLLERLELRVARVVVGREEMGTLLADGYTLVTPGNPRFCWTWLQVWHPQLFEVPIELAPSWERGVVVEPEGSPTQMDVGPTLARVLRRIDPRLLEPVRRPVPVAPAAPAVAPLPDLPDLSHPIIVLCAWCVPFEQPARLARAPGSQEWFPIAAGEAAAHERAARASHGLCPACRPRVARAWGLDAAASRAARVA